MYMYIFTYIFVYVYIYIYRSGKPPNPPLLTVGAGSRCSF